MEFKFAHNALPGRWSWRIWATRFTTSTCARIWSARAVAWGRCTAARWRWSAPTPSPRRWRAWRIRSARRRRRWRARARNAHQSPPRHADAGEYHRATALEALLGYLYVTGHRERMEALLAQALPPETIAGA